MWSDDCAYRRCGRGNWLEIRVPEGLFDAAKVPGTLLLRKVPGTLLLRGVPGTSCLESAWHIAPSQVALCLESAWHIAPSQVVLCLESAWHIAPRRGWNCACLKSADPSRKSTLRTAGCACHKSLNVPVLSCLALAAATESQ